MPKLAGARSFSVFARLDVEKKITVAVPSARAAIPNRATHVRLLTFIDSAPTPVAAPSRQSAAAGIHSSRRARYWRDVARRGTGAPRVAGAAVGTARVGEPEEDG